MITKKDIQNNIIQLTVKELDEIKRIEKAKGVGECQGHYKMSDETREAIEGLKGWFTVSTKAINDSINNLKDLFSSMKKDNDKDHEEIKTWNRNTNGNVRRNTGFRNQFKGAVAIISIFAVSLAGGAIFVLNKFNSSVNKLDSKIETIDDVKGEVDDLKNQLQALELIE